MDTFTKQDRQRAVTQTLASWAIEGFDPDVEYLALLDRYINGELSMAQVQAVTKVTFRAKVNPSVPVAA